MNAIEKKLRNDLVSVADEAKQLDTPSPQARAAVARVFGTVSPDLISFRRSDRYGNEFELEVAGFKLRAGRRLVVRRWVPVWEPANAAPQYFVEVRTRWSDYTSPYGIGDLVQLLPHCKQTPL